MNTPYTSQQPIDDFGLRFADLLFSATLTSGSSTTLTIPGNSPKYKAVIKSSGLAWVALNGTAAVPASSSFTTSTSEMINYTVNLCREVNSGDALEFISSVASTQIGVTLYSLNTNN